MSNEDPGQLEGELTEMFCNFVRLEVISESSQPGARLTVCRMSYTPQSSDSSRARPVRQTAVVLSADDLDLPQFVLHPHLKGILGKLSASLGVLSDINFDDSPEFSDAYLLHGWAEEPVRLLFNKSLRDHFADRPGWSVRGNGNRLVVFRHNQICPDDAVDEFVQDALAILELFREAESELDQRPDVQRETTAQDMHSSAARMGGIAGAILQNQLRKLAVSEDELQEFLKAAVPRPLPPGLKRQVLGDNFMLIIIGAIFFVAGVAAGSASLMIGGGPTERGVGLLFLILFPLIGGLMAGLTIRHRRRKARVLQYGVVTEGRVSNARRTSIMVNSQLRHVATVEYHVDGQSKQATCNVYGSAADNAHALHKSGNPVTILVDPADPKHVVCTDFLLIFDDPETTW
ncbi:MAG: DUF3592 domain-containing protein [Fuerstiella sp.]